MPQPAFKRMILIYKCIKLFFNTPLKFFTLAIRTNEMISLKEVVALSMVDSKCSFGISFPTSAINILELSWPLADIIQETISYISLAGSSADIKRLLKWLYTLDKTDVINNSLFNAIEEHVKEAKM